jgi:hypothetical protein
MGVGSVAAQSEDHRQGFPPLAGIRISVPNAQLDQLKDTLRGFAASEGLKVEEGEFPKQGRPVTLITLRLDERTFFHMDNFRNPGRFAHTLTVSAPAIPVIRSRRIALVAATAPRTKGAKGTASMRRPVRTWRQWDPELTPQTANWCIARDSAVSPPASQRLSLSARNFKPESSSARRGSLR